MADNPNATGGEVRDDGDVPFSDVAWRETDTPISSPWRGWWRWPLVPFASLVTLVLAYYVVFYGNWIVGGFGPSDGLAFRYLVPSFSALIAGSLYSGVAGYVAPYGKVITATVFTTLLVAFLLFCVPAVWKMEETNVAFGFSLSAIAACVGAIGSFVVYAREIPKR